ncbi:diaminopimelate epimerase [Buchnera aphidicola]|uniref:Diaminopimelate epimerase n=1 Tax=Buchnera aphidicola (Stegophylla sp.) TaxID=2315800 RepID=A0A4D6Y9X3_9GAMM|nr:diaminopimelate epimerase [Buchnera aphidicola (Stegophylla sp.)]QCI26557.1 diaminopimelate epimerase [Buchnera aphidicola (Stegophylla sp.)]
MFFSKMHGLGNDFVIINKINQNFYFSKNTIYKLANRHTGIGFDQLLIIEKPKNVKYDFYYRIFNSNGLEVNQCGNGARCFAYFVYFKKITSKKKIILQTKTNILYITIHNENNIEVNMGKPSFYPHQIPILFPNILKKYSIKINNTIIKFGAIYIGNPHCVIIVNDINTYPVHTMGRLLSKHYLFPDHINVNFIQIINSNHIFLRVYERGVGETQACGSGACASVVIGIMWKLLDSEVQVTLPGGNLKILWTGSLQDYIYMIGPAKHVYDGQIYV